jgi:3-methyladenine DNA glycosylase AlkD
MDGFVLKLRQKFSENANSQYAFQMKAYMRNQYDFFGINAPAQVQIRQEFLKAEGLPEISHLPQLIRELWEQPEREFQHFGMALTEKYSKKTDAGFIETLEWMIVTKSWWDTVDFIAANLVGAHFKRFPELIPAYTEKWMNSGNFWLQRSALLFQLKYKKQTDLRLLFGFIERLSYSREFFIRKAIGWTLREYSKTDPDTVIQFVNSHQLQPLSRKEAFKVINRKTQLPDNV